MEDLVLPETGARQRAEPQIVLLEHEPFPPASRSSDSDGDDEDPQQQQLPHPATGADHQIAQAEDPQRRGSPSARHNSVVVVAPSGQEDPRIAAACPASPAIQPSEDRSWAGSFGPIPAGPVRGLAREIRHLKPEDLLLLQDFTRRETHKDVYSLLPYTGSNWFVPAVYEVDEGEPRYGLGLSDRWVLTMTMFGYRLEFHLIGWLLRVGLLVLMWYALYNIFGATLVSPGGYIWDPLVTFIVSATVGGVVCRITQLPPLLGVLWVAIMWNNIPTLKFLTGGIVQDLRIIAQRVGLAIVLARAGFSMSLAAIRPHAVQSVLLSGLPYAIEMVVHGLFAHKMMGFDSYTWSFLQGSISSVISSAVIVPGVLYMQEQGFGKKPGSLSLLLSSVSIEISFGVWASNFILGLLFDDTSLAVAIVLGPVQIVGGAIIGAVVAYLFVLLMEVRKREAERLPTGRYAKKHTDSALHFGFALFVTICIIAMFLSYRVKLVGGGAITVVSFAFVVAHMWAKDGNRELLDHKMVFGRRLAMLWDWLVMPALFSMVGVGVDIKAIFNGPFLAKAFPVLAVSFAARIVGTFLSVTGAPITAREKLWVSVVYLAKATAQAAIGPTALTYVDALIHSQGPTAHLLRQREMALLVMQTSLLYVLVAVPIAVIALRLGPLILAK